MTQPPPPPQQQHQQQRHWRNCISGLIQHGRRGRGAHRATSRGHASSSDASTSASSQRGGSSCRMGAAITTGRDGDITTALRKAVRCWGGSVARWAWMAAWRAHCDDLQWIVIKMNGRVGCGQPDVAIKCPEGAARCSGMRAARSPQRTRRHLRTPWDSPPSRGLPAWGGSCGACGCVTFLLDRAPTSKKYRPGNAFSKQVFSSRESSK